MGNLWSVSSKSRYSTEPKKEPAVFTFKRRVVSMYYSDALSLTFHKETSHA